MWTCAQTPPVVDTSERVRANDIAAYLAAASFPFTIADGPPSSPVPSNDLTLNALVQHGVYKLDCNRAFLSLIDNRNQYICAEMTKNQPLGGQDPAQPLLLGTARIALEWGVCPYTMAIFHGKAVEIPDSAHIVADKSYFCINDFRQVPTFAARPYVAGYPHMVSYIEVPLRSLSGHILGSYCLVDNKPREFLRPEALRVIREVTSSISSYLNMKRAEGSRTRSERMMHGLRQFVDSERNAPSLGDGAAQSSNSQPNPFKLPIFNPPSQAGDPSSKEASPRTSNSKRPLSDSAESSPSSLMSMLSSSPETPLTSTSAPSPEPSGPVLGTDPRTSVPLMSTQISHLFSKAANSIGDAMNLDGLVFFDATTTSKHQGSSHLSFSPFDNDSLPSVAHQDSHPARSLSEYYDPAVGQKFVCKPSQLLIRQLTTAYPHGCVFAIDEHGVLEDHVNDQSRKWGSQSSDNARHQSDWSSLKEAVPNARYVLFLPLWHYQREACFATCLAWVASTGKTLDSGDKSSLTVFGNSLMANIFRLEAWMNTQSKSDFISSMSHELRSPLHGILTTLELMQETTSDPDLCSMVEMIGSCSSTLLDTFDHRLEFSKINGRGSNAPNTKKSALGEAADTQTTRVPVHLESLVDDVLEMVSLSHRSALQLASGLEWEGRYAFTGRAQSNLSNAVIVTTDIERDHNWVIPLEKGAWTRIILNICSNAMKYTQSGHINVALRILKNAGEGSEHVSFTVTDTSIGMSGEFLKYHLFTPFMQENNLSPGSGLGLNIVMNIVESLKGEILVNSRQHEGTRVTVNIPLDRGQEQPAPLNIDKNFDSQENLHGLSLGMLGISAVGNEWCLVSPPEVLQRSIRNICEGNFGMRFVDLSLNAPLDVDILLVDTHALSVGGKSDIEALFRKSLLGMSLHTVLTIGSPVEDIVCLASPITEKRLWSALHSALKKAASRLPMMPMMQSDVDKPRLSCPNYESSTGVLNGSKDIISRYDHKETLAPAAPRSTESTQAFPFKDIMASGNATIAAKSCRFRRFLLVDDNPINLRVLSAFAQRLGIPFSTAGDGAEAVHLYQQAALQEGNSFDCIFMDLSMPVMDGFQAVASIRQFEVEQQRLWETNSTCSYTGAAVPICRAYIFALTGLGSEVARNSARDLGFDEYLVKPVRFKDILPLLLTVEISENSI